MTEIDIKRMTVNPGDVIIAKLPTGTSGEILEYVTDSIRQVFPDNEVLTMIDAVELTVAGPDDWLPFDTAPKDGEEFDVWMNDNAGGYRIADVYWFEDHFRYGDPEMYRVTINESDGNPTHWRKKPEGPINGKQARDKA